ncbi:MAG: phosphoribosylglycinamide formyltransferase [Bacteroidales bacterium]|nr:phosphoribosylglycinamide formyltransferase [Bacteroidales bacterium]
MESRGLIRVAIFASGNGSNAENIFHYFKESKHIQIAYIVSNKKEAFVLERAKKLGVPSLFMDNKEFRQGNRILEEMKSHSIDFIVLAGFLVLIPANLIEAYLDQIINIHPALLPKFGGKGMYGDFVHRAVSESGELKTGITVHFVNQAYDEGSIIFQKSVDIEARENPNKIAEKVHALEYEYFPAIIKQVILSK